MFLYSTDMQIIRQRQPGEPVHLVNGDPIIIAEARIGAIVNFPVLEDQGLGYVQKMFEKYVRAPGSRIIAVKDQKIYLQKEFRWEGEGYEWRLPGGKVVDSFADFKQYLGKTVPESVIIEAARKELQEEAHLDAKKFRLFKKMICGTTVDWDLYYIIAEEVESRELDYVHLEGEDMQHTGWFTFSEVKKMCETGDIDEGRTVAALLQFIHLQKAL